MTDECGQATAETAAVLPALVLLTGMLLWGLMATVSHLQCVDAARAGARSAARGDPPAEVVALAARAAPRGARVRVEREDELVRVRVTARAAGPGPLAVELSAEAVARAEQPRPLVAVAAGGRRAGDGGAREDDGRGSRVSAAA
ncbi:TadE family type IV pilus minor pilin [Streptomyces durbertensis]|uniref:TadE family type IV pilus minor pilin n=1 Tax=Streptomyces durbertensis TaxID=2448886 RepID=UPI002B1F0B13|nr:TadE family type IV pilus minor pilin [Streptomyces durbertensis]